MDENRPSVSSLPLMIADDRILRVSLKLNVLRDHTIGHNLHTLLPFIGRIAIACLIFIIEDNDLTESILDLVAVFTCLVSPLL